jgi:prophage antirepressor-like protein
MRIEIWLGHEIRFVEKEPGDWWAVATDVTAALGIKNTSEAVRGNPKKNALGVGKENYGICKLYTISKRVVSLIVNEIGIYTLIFRSNKPEAEQFQRWVYEMLRELRRASGLEGYQVFLTFDKKYQREQMDRVHDSVPVASRRDYITANTIADKAVSLRYGFEKMVKKPDMTPEMLVDRETILNDTVDLIILRARFNLVISVSKAIYEKYAPKERTA